MATPRKTAEAPVFSFDVIKPVESEFVPVTTKSRKANPFHAFVVDANEKRDVWFKVGPIPEAHKQEAYNMLRRAQKDLGCGLFIREEDHEDGTYTYHYAAGEKKKTKYTVKDIRAWAATQSHLDPSLYEKKMDNSIRDAYKNAHGIPIRERQR